MKKANKFIPMEPASRTLMVFAVVGCGLLIFPGVALAYGGPGSVVTGIGALLAVLAAIAAAIFGFVWFPVKRLLRKLRNSQRSEEIDSVGVTEDSAEHQ